MGAASCNFTFPDREYVVPLGTKCCLHTRIADSIVVELRDPELAIPLRHGCLAATLMRMPKATVYKYCPALLAIRDVR